jgi:hypothetical protein
MAEEEKDGGENKPSADKSRKQLNTVYLNQVIGPRARDGPRKDKKCPSKLCGLPSDPAGSISAWISLPHVRLL